MEIAQLIGELILLSAIIIVGVIQHNTIKAQKGELQSIRAFMEIFDMGKVKDYVDITSNLFDLKAEKTEGELKKVRKNLGETTKELEEMKVVAIEGADTADKGVDLAEKTLDLVKRGLELVDVQFGNMYTVTKIVVSHFEVELQVAQMEEGSSKQEKLDKLLNQKKEMLPDFRFLRDSSKKVIDKAK